MSMYPLCHVALAHSESSLILTLFLGGLVGSISHCVGMCGPFVLAQVSGRGLTDSTSTAMWMQRLLLPYHLGRTTTYTLLGIVVSLLTMQTLQFPALAFIPRVLLVLAGIAFLASAFSDALPQFSLSLCGAPSWLMARVSSILPSHALFSGYILGVLLGFLPCGLVYAALLAVASTGDPFKATIGMIFFALGTMPALMAISLGGHALLPKRQIWVKVFSMALMAFNGITLFILAGKGLV